MNWAQDIDNVGYAGLSDPETCTAVWANLETFYNTPCAGGCGCSYDSQTFLEGQRPGASVAGN